MKTRFTWILHTVVLLTLAPLLAGCPKTTGGGWFLSYDEYDDADIVVTFGFDAQPIDEGPFGDYSSVAAKGRFLLIAHHLDHTLTKVHGVVDGTYGPYYDSSDPETLFWGECTVNGEEGYRFQAEFRDSGEPGPSVGDEIGVKIDNFGCGSEYDWSGYLDGGNLKVQQRNEFHPGKQPGSHAPTGMVLIPDGSFQMGDRFNEGGDVELPVHGVNVSAFYMDATEVTKAKWDEVYNWAVTNGYTFMTFGQGKATNHPVQTVSWYDCVKWANARSEMEGLTPAYYTSSAQSTVYRTGEVDVQNSWVCWNTGYRLPTEAEWEKAARGGADGRRFPWSDSDTIQHSRANYYSTDSFSYDTSPTRNYHPDYDSGSEPYTSPVGSFAANEYGLYDMAGNVWEWCWDWYSTTYYGSSPGTDPRGPESGLTGTLRGGSYRHGSFARACRVANRAPYAHWGDHYSLGFRLVRAAQ